MEENLAYMDNVAFDDPSLITYRCTCITLKAKKKVVAELAVASCECTVHH